MSQYKNLANNPSAQPFNVSPKRNKTKKNSWWNPLSTSYFRTKGNKKTKQAFTQED